MLQERKSTAITCSEGLLHTFLLAVNNNNTIIISIITIFSSALHQQTPKRYYIKT